MTESRARKFLEKTNRLDSQPMNLMPDFSGKLLDGEKVFIKIRPTVLFEQFDSFRSRISQVTFLILKLEIIGTSFADASAKFSEN